MNIGGINTAQSKCKASVQVRRWFSKKAAKLPVPNISEETMDDSSMITEDIYYIYVPGEIHL